LQRQEQRDIRLIIYIRPRDSTRHQDGLLLLETSRGGRPISGADLAWPCTTRAPAPGGAQRLRRGAHLLNDPFPGRRKAWLQPASPQYRHAIRDHATAAIAFARTFTPPWWTAIRDAALGRVPRKAIYLSQGNGSWSGGTPVLHMLAPDGVLFDLGGKVASLAHRDAHKATRNLPARDSKGDSCARPRRTQARPSHGSRPRPRATRARSPPPRPGSPRQKIKPHTHASPGRDRDVTPSAAERPNTPSPNDLPYRHGEICGSPLVHPSGLMAMLGWLVLSAARGREIPIPKCSAWLPHQDRTVPRAAANSLMGSTDADTAASPA